MKRHRAARWIERIFICRGRWWPCGPFKTVFCRKDKMKTKGRGEIRGRRCCRKARCIADTTHDRHWQNNSSCPHGACGHRQNKVLSDWSQKNCCSRHTSPSTIPTHYHSYRISPNCLETWLQHYGTHWWHCYLTRQCCWYHCFPHISFPHSARPGRHIPTQPRWADGISCQFLSSAA